MKLGNEPKSSFQRKGSCEHLDEKSRSNLVSKGVTLSASGGCRRGFPRHSLFDPSQIFPCLCIDIVVCWAASVAGAGSSLLFSSNSKTNYPRWLRLELAAV
jgi:hypothetical protein